MDGTFYVVEADEMDGEWAFDQVQYRGEDSFYR